jgi:hypothetical protein
VYAPLQLSASPRSDPTGDVGTIYNPTVHVTVVVKTSSGNCCNDNCGGNGNVDYDDDNGKDPWNATNHILCHGQIAVGLLH